MTIMTPKIIPIPAPSQGICRSARKINKFLLNERKEKKKKFIYCLLMNLPLRSLTKDLVVLAIASMMSGSFG